MAGNIDLNFFHDLNCFRMNVTGRLRPGALHVDKIARSLSQNTFRNRGFQTQNVELLEGQRGQELKTASYLLGDLPEGSPLF